jgi:type VI secretion system secreted protein Hcp
VIALRRAGDRRAAATSVQAGDDSDGPGQPRGREDENGDISPAIGRASTTGIMLPDSVPCAGPGRPLEQTMSAFLKLGDIKGEATDAGHTDWILIESMSAPIHRSIPEGARDQQRTKGDTTLHDVTVVRQLDKSSTKLAEACASGKFFPEAEIHLCTVVKGKQEPYLKYRLKDVIVSSYSFTGAASGDPLPTEQVTMGYTEVEWTYVVVDPKTGEAKGNVPGKYNPGTAKAG